MQAVASVLSRPTSRTSISLPICNSPTELNDRRMFRTVGHIPKATIVPRPRIPGQLAPALLGSPGFFFSTARLAQHSGRPYAACIGTHSICGQRTASKLSIMDTLDLYRYCAREYTRWANESTNGQVRQILLEVARLCIRSALNERATPPRNGNNSRGRPNSIKRP